MVTTLSVSAVPVDEIKALTDLRASLPDGSELGKALGEMSDGLRRGVEVTVAGEDDRLTPARAAVMLGVSRTHLYKILDAGLLPYILVGERDRRILVSDLHVFLQQSMAFRAADAQSVAKRQQLEDDLLDSM